MFGAPPVGHVMDPQFKPVFFYNSIFPLKMHSNCEHHMILCIPMEDLGKKMEKWGLQGVYVCMLLVMILCWGSMFHLRL